MRSNDDIQGTDPLPRNRSWLFGTDFIRRSWNGSEPIWRVFWIYGAPVLLVAFYLSLPYPSPLFVVIFLTYFTWLQVSLWRCAYNSRVRWFGYIARTMVIVMILFAVLLVFARMIPTYQGF